MDDWSNFLVYINRMLGNSPNDKSLDAVGGLSQQTSRQSWTDPMFYAKPLQQRMLNYEVENGRREFDAPPSPTTSNMLPMEDIARIIMQMRQ